MAGKIIYADGFFPRLAGLLGKKKLPPGEGIWLKPCRQVHTMFMSFPIDVIFLDEKGRVIGLVENMKPWKISRYFSESVGALELAAGRAAECRVREGEILELR